MANQAPLNPDGVVLEDKRPALVGVALDADPPLIGRLPDLPAGGGTVRVMTIRALDQTLQHAMAERLLEIRALLSVAGETQGSRLVYQQVLSLAMVDRVAVGAT